MGKTLIFSITSIFSVVNLSFAQISSNYVDFINVGQVSDFTESNWIRTGKKHSPIIKTFNNLFERTYVTVLNDAIIKRYVFTLFILPDVDHANPDWTLEKKQVIENRLISTSKLQDKVLKSLGDAMQHPSRTAIMHNIKPVILKDGKYFIVKNPVIGQCWEIVNRKTESPEEASPSTINTSSKLFSKQEIDQRKKNELEKMKIESKSQYPIGGKNIFADFVFLNEVDTVNNLYKFWYKPAEMFDGSYWGDGVSEFLYSPCVGIIGGSFDGYFRSLQIDPETSLMSKIQYGGFYRAYQIGDITAELYLKNCKAK